MDTRNNLQKELEDRVASEEKELQDTIAKLRTAFQGGAVNEGEASRKLQAAMMTAQKRLESERERMQRELSGKLEEADVKLNEHISRVQGQYKLWSVVLPPIPPLLIALSVFFVRRIRESGGVPVSRRRRQS